MKVSTTGKKQYYLLVVSVILLLLSGCATVKYNVMPSTPLGPGTSGSTKAIIVLTKFYFSRGDDSTRYALLNHLKNDIGNAIVTDQIPLNKNLPVLHLSVNIEADYTRRRTYILDIPLIYPMPGYWPFTPHWGVAKVKTIATLSDVAGRKLLHITTGIGEDKWSMMVYSYYRSKPIENAFRKAYARSFKKVAESIEDYIQITDATTLRGGVSVAEEATKDSDIPKVATLSVDVDIPPVTNIKNPDAIAVVIGNQNYTNKDVPSVDYAIRDAAVVREYLMKTMGFREGNIIYKPNASKATFEAIFGIKNNYKGRLYNYLKKGKSDIFIYYTGHGAPDPYSKQGYFVPVDVDPQAINLTGYPLQQLYDNIAEISKEMKPPNVFIVIDACFSGAAEKGWLLKNVSPISIEIKNPLIKILNAVVMTSSSGSELSSWYPEKGHSMFTYFFLKALRDEIKKGRSAITAGELFDFIVDETEGLPYYARKIHGRIQTPQIMGDRNRMLFK